MSIGKSISDRPDTVTFWVIPPLLAIIPFPALIFGPSVQDIYELPLLYFIYGLVIVVFLTYMSVRIARTRRLANNLIVWWIGNLFLMLAITFALVCWAIGTTANFSIELSRMDALYFALGTLTTAGTSTIAPTGGKSGGSLRGGDPQFTERPKIAMCGPEQGQNVISALAVDPRYSVLSARVWRRDIVSTSA